MRFAQFCTILELAKRTAGLPKRHHTQRGTSGTQCKPTQNSFGTIARRPGSKQRQTFRRRHRRRQEAAPKRSLNGGAPANQLTRSRFSQAASRYTPCHAMHPNMAFSGIRFFRKSWKLIFCFGFCFQRIALLCVKQVK